jgi:hypothetical protein
MKKKSFLISFIIDQSGSMETIRSDVIGSFNSFIKEQKKIKGRCKVYYSVFNDDVKHRFKNRALETVRPIDEKIYKPSGCTALLDAIGSTINLIKSDIECFKAKNKPDQVICVIITDGLENSSREFTRKHIFDMISKCKEDGWIFTYLAAGQDAIKEASTFNIDASTSMDFDQSSAGYWSLSSTLTNQIGAIRKGVSNNISYTDREREESMKG